MRKVNKYWMIVLLGGVLMATLVGVAAARPNDRPVAAISRRITVDAGHFSPHDHNAQYSNEGYWLLSLTDGSSEYLVAPVVFPTGQAVVVESVTLYAYDNNASDDICLYLRRTDPTVGLYDPMGSVCSTGSSSNDPRNFTDSEVYYNPVKHGRGVHLEVEFEDDTNLKFYGVRIQYHHGTT